jgi:hypothetical protein
MRIGKLRAALVAVLVVAGACTAAKPQPAPTTIEASSSPEPRGFEQIEHLIFIVQENRFTWIVPGQGGLSEHPSTGAVPGMLISVWAKQGFIDHQTLTFDAYLKLIEDLFRTATGWIPRP